MNGNPLSLETSNVFVNVVISVDPDGKTDVYYKDYPIFTRVQLPGFTPFTGAQFGFGARTGGANENCWIDDLCINSFTLGGPIITQQPTNSTINEFKRVLFVLGLDGLPPFSLQWYSNNVAIAGANGRSYLTPVLNRNQNGARYFVTISNFGTAASRFRPSEEEPQCSRP